MLAREERILLGNRVKDCFYVEQFFLFKSTSLYVTSVGLSIT